MASLGKLRITRYLDAAGKQVSKGTPGARKVSEPSHYYYIFYRDGASRLKKVSTECAHKDNAEAFKINWLKERERGRSGIADPNKKDLDRPLEEHLAEYMPFLRQDVTNEKYVAETERIIKRMFTACKAKTLRELTSDAIDTYLNVMKGAPSTKKKHHSAMSGLIKWLFRKNRIPENIMLRVPIPRGKVKQPLRSMSREEVQAILDAARQRTLNENLMIRRGKRKGQLVANLRPEVKARLEREGRERALLYKFAALTAMRKEEIARVNVGLLDFEHKPYSMIDLPEYVTKNGYAAKLFIPPTLATDLQAWIAETGKGPNDHLFYVPDKLNKLFQKDRKAAGVEYKDSKGGVAKFRSLRKSANVMLGSAGIDVSYRRLFMRHSDIRLTSQTYDDTALHELTSIVPALEALNLR